MDSDSDHDHSPTRGRLSIDGGESNGRAGSSVGGSGARAPVLALEENSGWGGALDGEETDRVSEVLHAGGMMSATAADRKKMRQAMHQHTFSAPSLTFTPLTAPTSSSSATSNAALTLDTSTIPPPPDKSGWLYKRGNLNSSWKKRWFVLRYQTLKYYKKSGDSKPKGFISLSGALLTPGGSEKMQRLFGFEISSMKYSRVFVIHADSEGEMKDWLECLHKNIEYVSLVIERERRQNAGASGAASTPAALGSETLKSFGVTNKKLAPEQCLELEMSEDYLKSAGILPRLSAWRRDVQRSGFDEQTSKLVTTSSLRAAARLPVASCFAAHNQYNCIAVGLGSSHPDDQDKGAVQIINVDTRDQGVSHLSQLTRIGAELGSLASNLRPQRKSSDERKQDDLAQVASMTIPCTGEVTALSWMDDRLFVGSSGGIVAMFKLPEPLASISGDLQPVQFLQHDKVATIPLAAPGKWIHTSRIAAVALNPLDKKMLLTLANQYFFMWDVERGTQLAQEIGSTNSAPLFAAAWNPHSAPEFMFGGEEGALRLLDTRLLAAAGVGGDRSKCVSWFAPRAHTDVIRDVAWSPLVPHWIASAGDDGLIKIWDTRFGTEPVRVLSGHTNGVTKVGWSKSHCEMLVSSSLDKTSRVWNMRTSPHHTMYTHSSSLDDFSAPLVHASFSPQNPFQVFVGSTSGECTAMHLQRELVANYAVTRNTSSAATPPQPSAKDAAANAAAAKKLQESDEKKSSDATTDEVPAAAVTAVAVRSASDDAQEREIYTLLYLRDYDRAFKAVAQLAHKYWQQGSYVFANQLLKLTGFTSFVPVANEPSKAAPGTNTLKTFNALLLDLSRLLPPNSLRLSSRDPVTQQRIDFLKTRLVVADRIQAGKHADILALSGEICAHLERASSAGPASSPSATGGASLASSPTAALDSMDQFDAPTLEKMALTILPHDHLRGLEFCIRIAKTLKDSGNFSLFIGIARVVFGPTIYERLEAGSPASIQSSYVRILAPLAHTPIGASLHAHREESHSESDTDTESSTNSLSSSNTTTSSRKPSDADSVRPTLSTQKPAFRPSVSIAGSPPAAAAAPTPTTTNARGSITIGSEVQHAQITLDRDLRNPKIVLNQLTLLWQLFNIVANDEEATAKATAAGAPSSSGAAAKVAPVVARFNPYLAKQVASVSSRTSLETLGMPPLSSAAAKEVARLVEEQKEPQKLVPSVVHFLYFHSLIIQKKYDLVFVAATKIGSNSVLKSYQLAHVLEGVMNLIVAPKFQTFLERLLAAPSSAASSKAAPGSPPVAIGANLSKLQAASLTIINMCFNSDYLPAALGAILPRFFRDFHEATSRTLQEMRSNPAYVPSTSYSTAKADVKAKVEAILGQIHRIRSHAKAVGEPHLSDQIQDFQTMLKRFVEP